MQASWRSGPCRASWTYRLRPVRRLTVRDGPWSGPHTGGGTLEFEVVNAGREAYLFAFSPSPLFRCSDGSSYRHPGYLRGTGLAWMRRDGRFAHRHAENDWLFTTGGRLRGSAAAGAFRIIRVAPGRARRLRHRHRRLQREPPGRGPPLASRWVESA